MSTQLLDYKALVICTYNLANKYDIYLWDSNYWCCYYGNKVIHNTCNMALCDLPDMYTQSLRACGAALGLRVYISGKSLMAMLQLLHIPEINKNLKFKKGVRDHNKSKETSTKLAI